MPGVQGRDDSVDDRLCPDCGFKFVMIGNLSLSEFICPDCGMRCVYEQLVRSSTRRDPRLKAISDGCDRVYSAAQEVYDYAKTDKLRLLAKAVQDLATSVKLLTKESP